MHPLFPAEDPPSPEGEGVAEGEAEEGSEGEGEGAEGEGETPDGEAAGGVEEGAEGAEGAAVVEGVEGRGKGVGEEAEVRVIRTGKCLSTLTLCSTGGQLSIGSGT